MISSFLFSISVSPAMFRRLIASAFDRNDAESPLFPQRASAERRPVPCHKKPPQSPFSGSLLQMPLLFYRSPLSRFAHSGRNAFRNANRFCPDDRAGKLFSFTAVARDPPPPPQQGPSPLKCLIVPFSANPRSTMTSRTTMISAISSFPLLFFPIQTVFPIFPPFFYQLDDLINRHPQDIDHDK